MLLNHIEEALAYCHLTKIELRQLYRRFRHPSIRRLTKVLEHAGHSDVNHRMIKYLTKYCEHCQLYSKSPGRFKFTLKDDHNFNYQVIIDILYLDKKPILYAVNNMTIFNAT